MSDAPTTITQLALDLHTDLANIKIYADKSPKVTRALIAEADAKLVTIGEYLGSVRHGLNVADFPAAA